MVESKYSIIWSNAAELHLRKIFDYIKEDSIRNAETVLFQITRKVDALVSNPERFLLDKYKRENDGSYRAFEIYSFRVSYRILERSVRILRIRSTQQKPLKY